MPSPRSLTVALALLAATPFTMAATAPATAPATALTCHFQAAGDGTGRVTVSFTLRNAGPQDLHLLRWGSPFEGAWFGPFMAVRTATGELKFQGALRKRGDPSAADYLLLPAGQSAAATVTLNDAFALPAAGTLTLQAAWRWHDVMSHGTPPRPRDRHQGLDQDCGSVTLTR